MTPSKDIIARLPVIFNVNTMTLQSELKKEKRVKFKGTVRVKLQWLNIKLNEDKNKNKEKIVTARHAGGKAASMDCYLIRILR